MKGQRSRRIIIWLGSVLFLLACALPLASTASPTQIPQSLAPELLGTSIVQTAAAAQTQTIVYLPPSLTPTRTPFPTWTPSIASSTPTFLFALPTITPWPTWTPTRGIIIQIPGGVGNATSNSDSPFTGRFWSCGIRERTPSVGTVIEKGTDFYATVTLFNTGTKTWTYNSIDFIYKSGFRIEGKLIQDLPFSIPTGKEITLQLLLTAPKRPGTYNTIWTLKVGKTPFCGVKLTFKVE